MTRTAVLGASLLCCSPGDDTSPEDGGPPMDSAADGPGSDASTDASPDATATDASDGSVQDGATSDALANDAGLDATSDGAGDGPSVDGEAGDSALGDAPSDAFDDGAGDAAICGLSEPDAAAPQGDPEPNPVYLETSAPCGQMVTPTSFSITNKGTAAITWCASVVPYDPAFGISIHPASSSLAPNEQVLVQVDFPDLLPRFPERYKNFGGIVVIDVPGFKSYAYVDIGVAADGFYIDPTPSIDFGDVAVGSTAEALVSPNNPSETVWLSYDDLDPTFLVEQLPPWEALDTYRVTFAPAAVGTYTTQMAWTVHYPVVTCSPNPPFSVSGRGI